MLFFGTDGSSNHNLTLVSVILYYFAIFLASDVDVLVAVRTPPNFSVINPCERLMALLNLALIGVALAREPLSSEEEQKVIRFDSFSLLLNKHSTIHCFSDKEFG